jgi:hypothetical protein
VTGDPVRLGALHVEASVRGLATQSAVEFLDPRGKRAVCLGSSGAEQEDGEVSGDLPHAHQDSHPFQDPSVLAAASGRCELFRRRTEGPAAPRGQPVALETFARARMAIGKVFVASHAVIRDNVAPYPS